MVNENEKSIIDKLNESFNKIFGDEDLTQTDNIITLCDENGSEVRFEFLDLIKYKGKYYAVLFPVDEMGEACEVVILEFEESDNEEETYKSVDDQNTLMAVFGIFKKRFADVYNFID